MHDVDLMTAEVNKAKAEGVACIVDGGHADMGRSVDFLRQVSMKSGLPIVAGGGTVTVTVAVLSTNGCIRRGPAAPTRPP